MIIVDKGQLTRQKILTVSKNLFYEKGYDLVKVKDIIATCEIAAGNLTYYFPTKSSIAISIFSEYIRNIFKFIDTEFPEWDHFYYKNLAMSSIFNINIFNNTKVAIFYKEVMEMKSMHYLLRDSIVDVYEKLADSFGHNYDNHQFKYFYYADLGARHEIVLNYLHGNFPELSPIGLVKIVHQNTTLLLGVSDADFQRFFEEVQSAIGKTDFSHIKLL